MRKKELVEDWWNYGLNFVTGFGVWRGFKRTHIPKNEIVKTKNTKQK
jgi:hypothetical protein